jgi:hypothetical protein
MATTTTRNKGKSEFVKEVLGKNPLANTNKVNEAWESAGHEGTISATLVNKLRSSLGLAGNLRSKGEKKTEPFSGEKMPYTGKKRGRKPKNLATDFGALAASHSNGRKSQQPASKFELRGKANSRHGTLEELEAEIDRLLFKVMGLGGLPAIEESLRRTRRLLYRAFAV